MQMIAASKMNRAQNMVMAGRPYADRIRDVLGDLAALAGGLAALGVHLGALGMR